jgi:hypothetical protein
MREKVIGRHSQLGPLGAVLLILYIALHALHFILTDWTRGK